MRRALLAVPVLALVLAGCGGTGGGGGGDAAATAVPSAAPVVRSSGSDGVFGRIPKIVDAVQPSVVSVLVRTSQGEAIGSGVIWNADGTIVTNNHVVENARSVQVAFASGRRIAARVRATDPLDDLAVLTVKAGRKLPAAHFRGGLPQVGELAVAIGTPLGFEETVTAGIVSGLHRNLPAQGAEARALIDLIQTDAPISPGNSGGALVDRNGRVMGINVAFIPPQARAVAIGFAIPAPRVVDVVHQLLTTGHVEHAFLGVQSTDVTPEVSSQYGLGTDRGALVIDVVSGSSAANAGIRPGDVIVGLGGRKVASVEDLIAALGARKPGQTVQVAIVRDGKRRTLQVTLAKLSGG